MTPRLPLTALLSRALVAFTIEFDNEFEHRMQHRITRGAAGDAQRGPWLVSMVMWLNCMRFVGEQPVAVSEVERLARTRTNLDGMRRWGYVALEPRATGRAGASRAGATIRATRWGLLARKVWRPLAGEVEDRWRERFGADRVARLREPLAALAASAPAEWPDCMPILGYGLFTRARLRPATPTAADPAWPSGGGSASAGPEEAAATLPLLWHSTSIASTMLAEQVNCLHVHHSCARCPGEYRGDTEGTRGAGRSVPPGICPAAARQ